MLCPCEAHRMSLFLRVAKMDDGCFLELRTWTASYLTPWVQTPIVGVRECPFLDSWCSPGQWHLLVTSWFSVWVSSRPKQVSLGEAAHYLPQPQGDRARENPSGQPCWRLYPKRSVGAPGNGGSYMGSSHRLAFGRGDRMSQFRKSWRAGWRPAPHEYGTIDKLR